MQREADERELRQIRQAHEAHVADTQAEQEKFRVAVQHVANMVTKNSQEDDIAAAKIYACLEKLEKA